MSQTCAVRVRRFSALLANESCFDFTGNKPLGRGAAAVAAVDFAGDAEASYLHGKIHVDRFRGINPPKDEGN